VPTAILSRQTAGIRGKALILNLPGKPKAIRETIDEVCAKYLVGGLLASDDTIDVPGILHQGCSYRHQNRICRHRVL
jgi:molybdopterin biosynthesis enzyme MoaB